MCHTGCWALGTILLNFKAFLIYFLPRGDGETSGHHLSYINFHGIKDNDLDAS